MRVSSKTGVIDVFASGISGTLLWGDRSGSEANTFANGATCIASGNASKCEFGAPGSVQVITPPDVCTIYLKDSGTECAAHIRGCTPGPRFTDQTKADDLKQLVAVVSFQNIAPTTAASMLRTSLTLPPPPPTMMFTGVNVQIVSGSGATDGPVNGSGNLIIGYNANTGSHNQLGSHNLIVGDEHTFSNFGGLVAGFGNSITGEFASVTGGAFNIASGGGTSITGGESNIASFAGSSIGGGVCNVAGGDPFPASCATLLPSRDASVSGGFGNRASAPYASVSGGQNNTASFPAAWVGGGIDNAATAFAASVSGGQNNTAGGQQASVSGGGGNTASGPYASVSGGELNTASGFATSVSGGNSLTESVDDGWRAGSIGGLFTGYSFASQ